MTKLGALMSYGVDFADITTERQVTWIGS
jgi:hypothetical protein